MTRRISAALAILLAGLLPLAAMAQDTPSPTPQAASPSPAPTATPAADATDDAAASEVVVTVNGDPITAAEIDAAFSDLLERQTRGRAVPANMMDQLRDQWRPRIIDQMINEKLMDSAIKKADVSATEEDFITEMEKSLEAYLVRNDMSREQLAENVQAQQGMPLDEFLKERAANPDFQRMVLMTRLLEKKKAEELAFSDEAVKERYEAEKDRVWSKPTQVQASHILIKTEPNATEEAKAAARKQAEEILAQVKQPDTDFAELAKEHSDCPSSAQGGDLGFFPRKGKMVEPFAAAAFDLKVGEVSDVVETQFGYHIIKVTDRKEAQTTDLEKAAPHIRYSLQREKLASLQQEYMDELKEKAEIEYADAPADAEEPVSEMSADEPAEKASDEVKKTAPGEDKPADKKTEQPHADEKAGQE